MQTEDVVRNIAESLHPLERKMLPFVKEEVSFEELSQRSGMPPDQILRPIQWLKEKGLVSIHEKTEESIVLGENGKLYMKNSFPENRLLAFLSSPKTLEEAKSSIGLSNEEFNISLGILRKNKSIEMKDGKVHGLLDPDHRYEEFLSSLPSDISRLSSAEKQIFDELSKRKDILRIQEKRTFTAGITDLGKKIQKIKLADIVDNLTPEMLATGSWKNKSFRRYDIDVPVRNIYGGKRHFVKEAIEYVRRIWLDLGFAEMHGSMINTSFWNFDALFTAQDHPVRDLQDTFFIKDPKVGKLPTGGILDAVRYAHERGAGTGSRGWQYKWSLDEAKKNVLRTHTTVLSAQTIARLKVSDLPAKYFSVGQCFRNETLDWSHLFEFHQAEGIVIEENANMRHLLGYLKEFFRKMGYDKVRARPAYFPYTEPSMEIDVYHPVHKKWVELGGSGIFRPEVTVPLLGKDVPVLAWGIGLGRIVPEYYGITDIRDLYKNDLKQLREMKAWLK